jgi:hypothetical protein
MGSKGTTSGGNAEIPDVKVSNSANFQLECQVASAPVFVTTWMVVMYRIDEQSLQAPQNSLHKITMSVLPTARSLHSNYTPRHNGGREPLPSIPRIHIPISFRHQLGRARAEIQSTSTTASELVSCAGKKKPRENG